MTYFRRENARYFCEMCGHAHTRGSDIGREHWQPKPVRPTVTLQPKLSDAEWHYVGAVLFRQTHE